MMKKHIVLIVFFKRLYIIVVKLLRSWGHMPVFEFLLYNLPAVQNGENDSIL